MVILEKSSLFWSSSGQFLPPLLSSCIFHIGPPNNNIPFAARSRGISKQDRFLLFPKNHIACLVDFACSSRALTHTPHNTTQCLHCRESRKQQQAISKRTSEQVSKEEVPLLPPVVVALLPSCQRMLSSEQMLLQLFLMLLDCYWQSSGGKIVISIIIKKKEIERQDFSKFVSLSFFLPFLDHFTCWEGGGGGGLYDFFFSFCDPRNVFPSTSPLSGLAYSLFDFFFGHIFWRLSVCLLVGCGGSGGD